MSTQPTVAAVNARFGYDPKRFHYGGLSLPGDGDRIAHIVRFPRGAASLGRAEALTAGGTRWGRAVFDFAGEDAGVHGVRLGAGMLALTASALFSPRVGGVARSGRASGGRVYAIVEVEDTTAVVELITIRKGPKVFRRNGGLWVRDDALLDRFLSATPPPIVELEGAARIDVLRQFDGTRANQIVTDDQGRNAMVGPRPVTSGSTGIVPRRVGAKSRPSADAIHEAGRAARPVGADRQPENRPSRTPENSEEGPGLRPSLTASIAAERDADLADHRRVRQHHVGAASRWYYSDKGYAAGFDLVGALARADLDYQRRVAVTRGSAAAWALKESRRLRAREAELTILMEVI